MNIPTIVNLAKETATFVRYQDKSLWYRIDKFNFEFPIPIDDSGGGTFNPTEKGLTLMRWIRKHVTLLTEALNKQGTEE
jgi:hypothetical protein